ncbi:MAG: hypothetical protein WA618_15265, partial [Terriglobales bacterium]
MPDFFQSIGAAQDWSAESVIGLASEGGAFRPSSATLMSKEQRVRHKLRVNEAARLTADALTGRLDPFLYKQAWNPTDELYVEKLRQSYPNIIGRRQVGLRETMSYSDYSALTVDVLDRMLYGYYTDAPISNMGLVKKHTLRDFRLVARYEMDGAVKPFSRLPTDFPSLIPHGAGEPPTERAMQQSAREVEGSTQRVTYQPQLYQGMVSVNWRALVNDDLGIFQDLIKRLAISGNRTIYSFITGLYVSSTGWNTTLYNSTFANLVTTAYGAQTNNPPLSWQGILDARTVLAKQLDLDGQPIDFAGGLILTVGPSLENTATSMAKAIQVGISVGGGTQNVEGFPQQWLTTPNWPMGGVTVVVDKYLPLICTNVNGQAATMWSLTYDPNAQARPSIELGMLQGYETPQLFQKVP